MAGRAVTSQSTWACCLLFVLLLFSMKVFEIDRQVLLDGPLLGEDGLSSPSTVGNLNRIAIPSLFVCALLLFLSAEHARRQLIRRPGVPLFLVVTALVFMASIAVSDHPMISVRRTVSQLLFLTSALMLVLVIDNRRQLYLTIGLAFATVLAIDLALMGLLGTGFNRSGEFMGYHMNKNVAGNQYGLATMVFLYLAVARRNALLLLLALVGGVLLILSSSRTSYGSVAIFLVLSVMFRFSIARGMVLIATLIGALAASLVFSVGGNDPEIFTGRGELWNFLSGPVWERALLGHGYGAFWDVGPASRNLTEGDGFIQYLNTGHNGFIDLMLGTGLLGLTTFVFVLVAIAVMLALLDSRYFLAHYVFIAFLLSNVTETYLLYHQNVMWLMFVLLMAAAYVDGRRSRRNGHRSAHRAP